MFPEHRNWYLKSATAACNHGLSLQRSLWEGDSVVEVEAKTVQSVRVGRRILCGLVAVALLFLPLAVLLAFLPQQLAGLKVPSHWSGDTVDAVVQASSMLQVCITVAALVLLAVGLYAFVFAYNTAYPWIVWGGLVVNCYCALSFVLSYVTSGGGLHPYAAKLGPWILLVLFLPVLLLPLGLLLRRLFSRICRA